MSDVQSLDGLIEALRRLPGVGIKSAQRMAFHLLQRDQDGARQLARALTTAVESVSHCERCHTFTEGRICSICQDEGRDSARLCVVEAPADMGAMERTGAYNGYYYVLMGRLSPLDQLVAREGDTWTLRVESSSLAQPAKSERLRAALEAAGLARQLHVEQGAVVDSPARRNAVASHERQRIAEDIVMNHSLVQTLIRSHGAKIVPGSIKPVSIQP